MRKASDLVTKKEYISANGEKSMYNEKIFRQDELTIADSIINSLEGMTVESAISLLEKIKLSINQTIIHF